MSGLRTLVDNLLTQISRAKRFGEDLTQNFPSEDMMTELPVAYLLIERVHELVSDIDSTFAVERMDFHSIIRKEDFQYMMDVIQQAGELLGKTKVGDYVTSRYEKFAKIAEEDYHIFSE